jgi:hypothetical protein
MMYFDVYANVRVLCKKWLIRSSLRNKGVISDRYRDLDVMQYDFFF